MKVEEGKKGKFISYGHDRNVSATWQLRGMLIGVMNADNMDFAKEGRWWFARAVINKPEHRGQGIGSRMLSMLKYELLKQPSFKELLVSPGGYGEEEARQQRFYVKNGFVEIKEGKDKGAFLWTPQAKCACPCGKEAEVVKGDRIYRHRPDLADLRFFMCFSCGRYVGTHPDGVPKGTPADHETREARKKAHNAFDPLWRREVFTDSPPFASRSDAYRWLSTAMGVQEAHIGHMTSSEALRVVSLVRDYKTEAEKRDGRTGPEKETLRQLDRARPGTEEVHRSEATGSRSEEVEGQGDGGAGKALRPGSAPEGDR